MKLNQMKKLCLTCVVVTFLSACTTTQVDTTIGGAAGAGVGYAVGGGWGAVIGGGAGALIGHEIGKSQTRKYYRRHSN